MKIALLDEVDHESLNLLLALAGLVQPRLQPIRNVLGPVGDDLIKLRIPPRKVVCVFGLELFQRSVGLGQEMTPQVSCMIPGTFPGALRVFYTPILLKCQILSNIAYTLSIEALYVVF